MTVSKLADNQGWSSSLRQCVSAIKNQKWRPTRNKIISLGLHLGMHRGEIDTLLKLAYMQPLSATNIFEATVLYILESSELNFTICEKERPNNDFVIDYAAEIMKEIDDPEVKEFLAELQCRDEGE